MGRPKLDQRKPSKSVTLNENTIALLTALGGGNLSAGIEMATQGYVAYRAMVNLPPIVIPPPAKTKKN